MKMFSCLMKADHSDLNLYCLSYFLILAQLVDLCKDKAKLQAQLCLAKSLLNKLIRSGMYSTSKDYRQIVPAKRLIIQMFGYIHLFCSLLMYKVTCLDHLFKLGNKPSLFTDNYNAHLSQCIVFKVDLRFSYVKQNYARMRKV